MRSSPVYFGSGDWAGKQPVACHFSLWILRLCPLTCEWIDVTHAEMLPGNALNMTSTGQGNVSGSVPPGRSLRKLKAVFLWHKSHSCGKTDCVAERRPYFGLSSVEHMNTLYRCRMSLFLNASFCLVCICSNACVFNCLIQILVFPISNFPTTPTCLQAVSQSLLYSPECIMGSAIRHWQPNITSAMLQIYSVLHKKPSHLL